MKNRTGSGAISEYKSEYLDKGQKSKETSETVDKEGRKSQKTATYTYDLLGRITKETKTGQEDISYTYDSNNNRKEMRVGNQVTAYKYNKNDELLRTDTLNTDTEKDSVVIYKSDKNGNQLAAVNRYEIPSDRKDSIYVDIDVTLGDNRLNGNVVNHYNALNQLTKTLTKNYKVSFTYDAEGLRTSKTVNGEKTVFVWDGDQLVMELSGGGKVKKRYIRGNDQGYGSNLVYSDKGTDTEKQYYVTDPHGNVVQLADESGKVVKTYEYDSFGNEVNPDSKDENPFRYCGEYYDKETEEIYLRARYYQPAVGRFLTRDTYTGEEDEPLSLHLYGYCGNDGVNAWDPSGHIRKKAWSSKGKGKVYNKNRLHSLRICTDGANRNHYGDATPQSTTSAFTTKKGKCYIYADKIPYIVIPVGNKAPEDLSSYIYSLAVVTCKKNKHDPGRKKIRKGDYLYCIVAETNDEGLPLGEVSIYAAWKLIGAKSHEKIGENTQTGLWNMKIYEKSSPNSKKLFCGWKTSSKALRKQIIKIGKKCYKGTGKCLNYRKPKYIK